MNTLKATITAYDEIRTHDGSASTLGGRAQELPRGYAIDRILSTDKGEDGTVSFFVQCLDPVKETGYVWGWVAMEDVAIG